MDWIRWRTFRSRRDRENPVPIFRGVNPEYSAEEESRGYDGTAHDKPRYRGNGTGDEARFAS